MGPGEPILLIPPLEIATKNNIIYHPYILIQYII